jgi:hypothetical protein
MGFYEANKQFDENLKLFVTPEENPEKWNLYAGLQNLAQGLEELEERVKKIERHLDPLLK